MILSKLLHLSSDLYIGHRFMWSDSGEEREGPGGGRAHLCTDPRGWQPLPFQGPTSSSRGSLSSVLIHQNTKFYHLFHEK